MSNTELKKIAKELTTDLEHCYSQEQMLFIEQRLREIAEDNNLESDELAYYCDLNSSEMFCCIFDYKVFDANNF